MYNILISEDAIVSTSETEADQSISLFPNPANDRINISFKTPMQNVNLSIYNIQGQKIQEQLIENISTNQRETLNTTTIPNGIYFLELQSDAGRIVKKITIQR